MQEQKSSLHTQYDDPLSKIEQINSMLQKLITNVDSLEDLGDQITPEDYLELLANLIFSLNSVMFSYCQLKGQEVPEQFKKVKQYYSRVKDTLAGKFTEKKDLNPLKINKEAAGRLIKAGINQGLNS